LIHYENVVVWEQINSCTIHEKQSFQHGRTFRHLKLAWSKLFQLTISSSKIYQYKDSPQRHWEHYRWKDLDGHIRTGGDYCWRKNKKRDTISFGEHVRLIIKFLIVANLKESK